jgi:MFS family permease
LLYETPALTGAYSIALLVSAVASLAVGRFLDHHSPRLLMTMGSVLASILVLAWSRVTNVAQLYLIFAGLGIAMACVLY